MKLALTYQSEHLQRHIVVKQQKAYSKERGVNIGDRFHVKAAIEAGEVCRYKHNKPVLRPICPALPG